MPSRRPISVKVTEPASKTTPYTVYSLGVSASSRPTRLKALVSHTYEGFGRPGDPRLAIDPDVSVPFASADYLFGEDPVLDAALAA
jgi:hypothetical protein